MAYDPSMAYAVSGNPASSGEYNKVVDNVTDINGRITDASTGNPALGSRVTALEGASAVVGAWVDVVFAANWGNRSGSQYMTFQSRMLPGGMVEIKGNIARSSGSSIPQGEALGTLAAAHRPNKDQHFPAVMTNAGLIWIQVAATTGAVTCFTVGATTGSVINLNGQIPGPSAGV